MRTNSPTAAFNDHPFDGDGASLYAAAAGAAIRYRNLRLVPARGRGRTGWIKGQGGNHDLAASSVSKTNRVASQAAATEEIVWSIPSSFWGGILRLDVRRYKDDVENESENYRTATVELDANGDPIDAILGTAQVLDQEQRAGGVVRLRIAYKESRDGTQPTVFRATATAGPTSPAAATSSYTAGQRIVEIDTPALSDASAYTYKITAENSDATITKDVVTGLSVTADASGPPTPTGVTAAAV